MLNENAVNAILQDQAQLAQTQNQLATGKSINSPSDNPVGMVQVLQLDATNSQYQQYVSNGQSANTNLTLEENALTTSTSTLQSIRDLVVQANSGTNNSSDLQDIAAQISALENQLQGTANSQNAQGEYLFAGFTSGTQPFVRGATGSMGYVGDSGTYTVPIAGGTSVQTGDAGSSVFMNLPTGNGTFATSAGAGNNGTGVIDSGTVTSLTSWNTAVNATPSGAPFTISFTDATDYTVTDAGGNTVGSGTYNSTSGGEIAFDGVQVGITGAPVAGDTFKVTPAGKQSVFDTLDHLVGALNNAGTSSAARAQLSSKLNSALQGIDTALQQVSTVTSNVGARLNLISSVKSSLSTASTTVQAQISNLSDLDYAKATAQYSQQYIALQAAEQSFADINQLSLFKYL
jgi:flagellar hook-associated protein 3 FlgL